jgi:hypothetical protein
MAERLLSDKSSTPPHARAAAALVLFLVAAGAQTSASAASPEAKRPAESPLCDHGRLLIGALIAPDRRRVSDQIYTSIVTTLKDAIEAARTNGPCPARWPFSDVDSYDELYLRALAQKQVSEAGYLETIPSVLNKTKDTSLAAYIGIQVLERASGAAAQFFIYTYENGTRKLRSERVVSTDFGEDELLQFVSVLGQRIVRAGVDEPPPRAQIKGQTDLQKPLNEEILLDASNSSHPDFDKLHWRWRQLDGPALNMGDVDTARLHLHPSQVGAYEWCVQVALAKQPFVEAAFKECKAPSSQLVRLVVGNAPRLDPDVEYFDEVTTPRTLAGRCSDGISCVWEQVEGPSVPLNAQGNPPTITPSIQRPGSYRFRLRASNAFGVATQIWKVTLAPPPVIVWRPPRRITEGYDGILDASGTYDPYGQPVSYLWTVTRTTDASACLPGPIDEGTFVTAPTLPKTILQTNEPGAYRLTLQTVAPRPSGDRTRVSITTKAQCLTVTRKRFELRVSGWFRWGGEGPSERRVGTALGGSFSVKPGSAFRIHLQLAIFNNARTSAHDSFHLEWFGGLNAAMSYAFFDFHGWFSRVLAGGAIRAFTDPYAAPRAAVEVGAFLASSPIELIGGAATEYGYHFDDNHWHKTADLYVALGASL